MILYTKAFNESGELVGVKEAQRHGKFTCPWCNTPMVVAKGYKNEWHFRHKEEISTCNHETALHLRLKEVLYNRIINRDGIRVVVDDYIINLSDYNVCRKEHRHAQFIPDIYVECKQGIIFLEIHVNSPCSQEKRNSGIKIIEISPKSDDSIDDLSDGDIVKQTKSYNTELINFPIRDIQPEASKTTPTSNLPTTKTILKDIIKRGERIKRDKPTVKYYNKVTPTGKSQYFNGFFIVHEDLSYELTEFYNNNNRTNIKLCVKISVPDYDMAMALGKKYAILKGILNDSIISTPYEEKISLDHFISNGAVKEVT